MLAVLLGVAAASAADAGVTVEKPWMQFIIKARPAAGYFTLRNETGAAIALTGASSSACGMVMLHQTKEVNGVEKMLPVKSVAVPANGTVSFAPGGYHLMCMSPGSAMAAGATVPVTLQIRRRQDRDGTVSGERPGRKIATATVAPRSFALLGRAPYCRDQSDPRIRRHQLLLPAPATICRRSSVVPASVPPVPPDAPSPVNTSLMSPLRLKT